MAGESLELAAVTLRNVDRSIEPTIRVTITADAGQFTLTLPWAPEAPEVTWTVVDRPVVLTSYLIEFAVVASVPSVELVCAPESPEFCLSRP
ncbi:MAG: hypothetical protein HKN44_04070 [Ilumatobacter sp.]|nr:hypothetical protein [Ilumatobacter sp.]